MLLTYQYDNFLICCVHWVVFCAKACRKSCKNCLSCCSICWKFQSGKAGVKTFRFQILFSCWRRQSVSIRVWSTALCRRTPM